MDRVADLGGRHVHTANRHEHGPVSTGDAARELPRRLAFAVHHREPHVSHDLLGLTPCREVPYLIRTEDEEELGIGEGAAERPHRVDHVRRSVPTEFDRGHLEAWIRAHGLADHLQPHSCGGHTRRGLVRWGAGRDPQNAVEPEMVGDVTCDGDVPGMRRVEGSPEEPDPGRRGAGQGSESSDCSSCAESESGYSLSSRVRASSARSS
jgi:hypothetical protein